MAGSIRVTIKNDRTPRIRGAVPRAVAHALNRAIASVRTEVTRRLGEEMAIKQAIIRQRIKIQRASHDRPEASLRVTGKRIPLFEFAARQTLRGVTYRAPHGGRRLIPHLFIAQMRSGHRGVFGRRTRRRLPIVERFGASLPYVAIRQGILRVAAKLGNEAFHKNLKHDLAHELGLTGSP